MTHARLSHGTDQEHMHAAVHECTLARLTLGRCSLNASCNMPHHAACSSQQMLLHCVAPQKFQSHLLWSAWYLHSGIICTPPAGREK